MTKKYWLQNYIVEDLYIVYQARARQFIENESSACSMADDESAARRSTTLPLDCIKQRKKRHDGCTNTQRRRVAMGNAKV